MAREQFRFSHPLRVRWAEADMQGVVFNAHYLLYFDVGITEYWRALADGDPQRLREIFNHLYVVKSTVEYRAPAHFDDELEVCVRTERIGRSSLTVQFEIHRGSEHLISGENVYVHAHEGASSPVPGAFRELLREFEIVKPQE
ncbi:MAG: acyl-CoA thioesterase [Burkholderiales bacterium]|nr:acyl-CoA thioesterase [Burkholderiales bacterium]ODU66533.1 MAG: 4-hydroxybenzoyl-CoA thioesterase [Lautropia sp. SCN 66-9]